MNYITKAILKKPIILFLVLSQILVTVVYFSTSTILGGHLSMYNNRIFLIIVPIVVIAGQTRNFEVYSNINVLTKVKSLSTSYVKSFILDIKVCILFYIVNLILIAICLIMNGGSIDIGEYIVLLQMFVWLIYITTIKYIIHTLLKNEGLSQIGAVLISTIYYFFSKVIF